MLPEIPRIAATVSPPVVSTVAVGAVGLWDIPVRDDPSLPTFRPRAAFLFLGGGSAERHFDLHFTLSNCKAICNAAGRRGRPPGSQPSPTSLVHGELPPKRHPCGRIMLRCHMQPVGAVARRYFVQWIEGRQARKKE